MFDLDNWQEIYASLRKNRLRTLLTAFGVFWGIFLLVILLGSGNGMANGARSQFEGSATNSFFLWGQRTNKAYRGLPPGRSMELTLADVAAIRQQVPDAEIIAPRSQLGGFQSGNSVRRGGEAAAFNVMGDVPEILGIQALTVTSGRFVNPPDLEHRRKVAVIGSRVEELLYEEGEDPLGTSLEINGVYFKVVGTFASRQTGQDADRDAQTIFIPFTTFRAAFNQGDEVGWLAVTSREGVPAADVEEQVRDLLGNRHQVAPDDRRAFGSYNTERELARARGLLQGIAVLVWIVGTGTLAAGVIGVSNILLILVKERTREIGLRRAVGATPFAIVRQILMESVTLTAAAGYFGLLAGVGVLELVRIALAQGGGQNPTFQDPGVSFSDAVQALLILVLAGALAGLIPARRAVAIRPVEALRSE